MPFGTIIAIVLLVCLKEGFSQDDLSPIVQVEQGQVQGTNKTTDKGREFYAFQGIPFGKSPVGILRFKPPEPAEPWEDVYNATYDPPACMQIGVPVYGVEDCLQLNVYTPNLPSESSNPSLPVHVFIHGGAFVAGEIGYNHYRPDNWVDNDLVVVLIKYRLGPLGFLATDDEVASGNAGLLDQNLGLQWVQKNIAAFGGNPNNVTLSGQSAGSASVMFQYLSPMSAGLFNRVVAESGTPINPWALEENPVYYSKKMGEHFNCSTDSSAELVECLQGVEAKHIVDYSTVMMVENLTLCFVPSVETSPSGKFLTDDPLHMFETGNFNQVPLQLGFNRDEGDLAYDVVFIFFYNVTNITFDVVVPTILYALSDYRQNLINVSYAIKDFYYADVDFDNQTEVNIATIAWLSDLFMKNGISKTAALVSSHNVPTYLYAYDYVSNQTGPHFTGEPDIVHGDEMKYLWYHKIRDTEDEEFGNRFLQLWVQFILTGGHSTSQPNVDRWLPTPAGQYNYYDINEKFAMHGNYDTEHMNFWWNTVPSIVYP
ncbi:hypothetical protein CHUAL_014230 [Chamberlinius hualienensis]